MEPRFALVIYRGPPIFFPSTLVPSKPQPQRGCCCENTSLLDALCALVRLYGVITPYEFQNNKMVTMMIIEAVNTY